jgi:hypothetical protein
MKKSILTGMHGHGFCCEKGKKGKYMCCLVFKQILHTWNTCPLLIILFISKNIAKRQGKTLHIPSFIKTRSPWTVWLFWCHPRGRKMRQNIFVCSDEQHKIKVAIFEQQKNILLFLSSTIFYHEPYGVVMHDI